MAASWGADDARLGAADGLCWAAETGGEWLPRASVKAVTYRAVTGSTDDDDIERLKESTSVCRSSPPSPQCFRSTERYWWKPREQPAMRVDFRDRFRGRFCAIMRQRRIARLSFLGDSITRSMAHSLWSLLGRSRFEKLGCNGGQTAPGRVGCPPCCPEIFSCGAGLNVTVSLSEVTRVSENVSHVARTVLASDLTVLNFGAHYNLVHFNSSGAAYAAFVADALVLANISQQAVQAGKLVAYRSTPQPHLRCESFRQPTTPGSEQEREQLRQWVEAYGNADKYNWHAFPSFNAVARAVLEPVGVRWLDVERMSFLRPDAHTATRYARACGGSRCPPDCLHFTLPGVPDTWNALLFGALERCEPVVQASRLPVRQAGAAKLAEAVRLFDSSRSRAAAAAASARFFSSGLVVHVMFDTGWLSGGSQLAHSWLSQLAGHEEVLTYGNATYPLADAVTNKSHLVDASVLRYDLPIALASWQQDLRVGIVVTPRTRGCAYPNDAPWAPGLCEDVSPNAYVEDLRAQCGRQHSSDGVRTQGLCCHRDWETAFAAKRLAAGHSKRCVRMRARQHVHVRASYWLEDVDAVFYKAYLGETIDSPAIRTACRSAHHLALAITMVREAADPGYQSPVGVVKMTMPLREDENVACSRGPSRPNGGNEAVRGPDRECNSNQDDRFDPRAGRDNVTSPVSEADPCFF